MKFAPLFSLSLIASLTAGSGAALAAMSVQEVERLGKDLTPMGAEKAGNKDGSIPAWDGGLPSTPAGIDPHEAAGDLERRQ